MSVPTINIYRPAITQPMSASPASTLMNKANPMAGALTKLATPALLTVFGATTLGLQERDKANAHHQGADAIHQENLRHEASLRAAAEARDHQHRVEKEKEEREREARDKNREHEAEKKRSDDARRDRDMAIGAAVVSIVVIGAGWVWSKVNEPDYASKIAELEVKIKHLEDNNGSTHIIETLKRKRDCYAKKI